MIQHQKNTAYYLSFPMVDSATPESFKSGVSPVDTAYYKDGAGAWTSLAITDTATEIGSTGIYEIDLTAAELNHDYVIVKFAVSGAADTAFLFNLTNNSYVADSVWDETLSGAEHNVANSAGRRLRQSQEFQGYEGGAVWIDTVSGSAGTTVYDFGTVEVPSDNIADATTIATSLGYHRFRIAPGSTFTLAQTYNNYFFEGDGYTLALGGQDVTNCKFSRASSAITGIYSGTFPFFYECSIGAVSGTPAAFQTCGFSSTFTVTATGNYYLVDCFSQIAGGTAPVFDFGAAVAGTNMSIRRWSGGITINNLAAGDVVSLEGTFGTITLNGADATVEIRGICKNLVNNLTGSPTVNDDCVSADDIQDILTDTSTIIPASIAALNDVSVNDVLNTQMTESYAADGTAPTLAQALMLIQQKIGDFGISGTTLTVRELDGATTAATYTLNDDTNPTSSTRSA